jgi:cytosine/adenosine deaminase-related metal-dependent hydrolase
MRRGQRIELNMFDEMRAMRNEFGELPPNDILRMATSNGARALGLGGKIGQLCERAVADLIVLPFEGATKHVFESVLEHRGNVAASMIDGRWVTGRYANQGPTDGN